jgi:hypothetical protein
LKRPTLSRLGAAAACLAAFACSSSSRPAAPAAPAASLTPTPGPVGRVNPNVIEETATYTIQRYPKQDYIRVDDRHIRHPLIGPAVEFFGEDENYYYVHVAKRPSPEESALLQAKKAEDQKKAMEDALRQTSSTPASPTTPALSPTPAAVDLGPPDSEFADLSPRRVKGRLKLEKVEKSGLPEAGQWRASFVVADMNGDGIPDIVAPPARGGDTGMHIWIGDGSGRFKPWDLSFTENGKPANPSLIYGGVAVADIDGDGKLDIVIASHGAGVVSLFGDGKGGFRIVRDGLPKDFTSQAVALIDVDGDGKPDIVVSADVPNTGDKEVDPSLIRVFLYRGQKGWQLKPDGLLGGFPSNSLHAWDYDRDGRMDLLTGSIYTGALTLVWKNKGDGTFAPVSFPEIDGYAYHLSTAPGTFGPDRVPAFADLFYKFFDRPKPHKAEGISVDSFRAGSWTRHPVWIKREGTTAIFAIAMGDLDGDGLDDLVFPDIEARRLRIFFQEADGSFSELDEQEEPALDSVGQHVVLVDLNHDGRLDIVLSKTTASPRPDEPGGWDVYLNRGRSMRTPTK